MQVQTVPRKRHRALQAECYAKQYRKNNTKHHTRNIRQNNTKKIVQNTTNRILEKKTIMVITKLPNSEQSSKGKVKTHKYINRQNQPTTGKL